MNLKQLSEPDYLNRDLCDYWDCWEILCGSPKIFWL
jgi:hypothetical protein